MRQIIFTFENTPHRLGMRILGDRNSFYELHEMLNECWTCEDDVMSQVESCSYIGVISYFSYEVRHTFMGGRLVWLDGKAVTVWDDQMFRLFEKEQNRFVVGLDLSWPQMLFIMASWWECLKRQECPTGMLPIMRQYTENIESLLLQRSKLQYPAIEPYIHGAIYSANPYLMHTMEHINVDYLQRSRYCKVSLSRLAEMMKCAAYGTWEYEYYINGLKKHAKRLGCAVEDLEERVDESVYDMKL